MNELLKALFTPLSKIDKKVYTGVVIFWATFFLLLFEFFHSPIIPAPTKILSALIEVVKTDNFFDDLTSSLFLTIQSMVISIIITMVICYLSKIPFFEPIAQFVSKCRYQSLTALVCLFTFFTSNLGQLKMSLLLFGIVPFFTTSFLSALNSIPEQEIDKAYVNKRTKWETLFEVVIIGKLDQLFEVMRQNFAIAWMMITTVESYDMSGGGLGTIVLKSNRHLDLATIFAIVVIIFSLGLLFDFLLSWLRVLIFPYLKITK